jgi:hypothetical protein
MNLATRFRIRSDDAILLHFKLNVGSWDKVFGHWAPLLQVADAAAGKLLQSRGIPIAGLWVEMLEKNKGWKRI